MKKSVPLPDRFRNGIKINETNGCWEWQKAKVSKIGHGIICDGPRGGVTRWLTHRLSWTIHKGPIPSGLMVLHRCDNGCCCNPEHLFLGNQKDNMSDCAKKERTARGEKQGQSKLKSEQVDQIRASKDTCDTLSKRFGVSRSQISRIRRGERWIIHSSPQ